MSNHVDVSVIVPTYNRNEVLIGTLECLLKQEPSPLEIIVLDQGGERTAEAAQFLNNLAKDELIKYIRLPYPNAQRARNTGIAEAKGKVLLFVDDDVVMESGLVGAHWKNYENGSGVDAVCGFYLEPGEEPIHILPDYCNIPEMGWIYMPHCYSKRAENFLWPSCNGSVLKEVAVKIGGFDENFTHTLFDDTDFSSRMRQLKLNVVHDPEARLRHLKEPAGGKRPKGLNEYVIADSDMWYTWSYFFWANFGWRSWREIALRLRRCVFRKKNIMRPWYVGIAFWHFLAGCARAWNTLRSGRKLGFPV